MMQILAELASMPDDVAGLMAQVPGEKLAWVPPTWEGIPGERFTALGQACHLRDIERDGYHVRFGRTLREKRPDLASIDSYELAAARNDQADDVEAALIAFRTARRETVAMLQTVRVDDWNRRATFAEYGEVTLGGLAHILRSHDLQHLARLHRLTSKMTQFAPGGSRVTTPPRSAGNECHSHLESRRAAWGSRPFGLPTALVAVLGYGQPVVATALAIPLLGEVPGLGDLAGAMVVVAGLVLATRPAKATEI